MSETMDKETEITSAMIEAGAELIVTCLDLTAFAPGFSADDLAEKVFRAMEAASQRTLCPAVEEIETVNGTVQVSGAARGIALGILIVRGHLSAGTVLTPTQAEQIAEALRRRASLSDQSVTGQVTG